VRPPPSEIAVPPPIPEATGGSDGPDSSGGSDAAHWPIFDRDQLARVRSGDPDALGSFFDHYCDRIFAVVYRFTGSVEIGEDLTQEIFFKVRRHIGRLDLERDPAPWLYTVAVNTCHDHLRSSWWRMSRHSVPLDHADIGSELSGHESNPEDAALAAEDERRVHWAIGRLAPDLRMSVILHDFQELPHEQIAVILGIRHDAARKRHSRALAALAALLKEEA
jgi:RNA polymerase sigma-70 factor (ECF subfamily)